VNNRGAALPAGRRKACKRIKTALAARRARGASIGRPKKLLLDAPEAAGVRFIRGFTRIGAITTVVVALSGVALSITFAVESYNYSDASEVGSVGVL
jgi:hypothetical protein